MSLDLEKLKELTNQALEAYPEPHLEYIQSTGPDVMQELLKELETLRLSSATKSLLKKGKK